jgi:hypothetical protein
MSALPAGLQVTKEAFLQRVDDAVTPSKTLLLDFKNKIRTAPMPPKAAPMAFRTKVRTPRCKAHTWAPAVGCWSCAGVTCPKCSEIPGITDKDKSHPEGVNNCKRNQEIYAAQANRVRFGSSSASPPFSINPDSGCSISIVKDPVLSNTTRTSVSVGCANGTSMIATSTGDLSLGPLQLQDCLYVPDAIQNLLSIHQICEGDYQVLFSRSDVKILPPSAKVIGNPVIEGTKVGNQWSIDLPSCKALFAQSVDASTRLLHLHHKLGHLNQASLKHLIRHRMVEGLPDDCRDLLSCTMHECLSCKLGKSTRLPFPSAGSRATRAGQTIHIDICDMGEPTHDGYRYLFCATDDFTSFTISTLLKYKRDAWSELDYTLSLIKTHFNREVETVRGDNEFGNNHCWSIYRRRGIRFLATVPHTPQQNGLSERTNYTLCNGLRTLLSASGLPLRFWGEALRTVLYCRNRSPNVRSGTQTPYEQWYGRKPDISNLRVFGEPAVVHVLQPYQNGKLEPRGILAVFLSYSDIRKAYRLLLPHNNKIVESRDVSFFREMYIPTPKSEDLNRSPTQIGLPRPMEPIHSPVPVGADEQPAAENTPPAPEIAPVVPPTVRIDNSNDVITQPEPVSEPDSPSDPPTETVEETAPLEPMEASEPTDPSAVPIHEPPPLPAPRNINSSINVSNILPQGTRRSNRSNSFQSAAHFVYAIYDDEGRILQQTHGSKGHHCLRTMVDAVPRSYKDITNHSDAKEWYDSSDREMKGLLANDTWELVPLPVGRKAIGCKWVYRLKLLADKSFKYKARLTALGCSQQAGQDYDPDNLYAPVARQNTLRVFLSIAASKGWEIDHGDIDQAFLIPKLHDEIYMRQPEGYVIPGKENFVLRLKKSLYGLKQSPSVWNAEIDAFIKSLGFKQLKADRCLYARFDKDANLVELLLVYVDDLLFAGSRTSVDHTKGKFAERFPFKNLGDVTYVLGFEIERDRASKLITLHQHSFIANLLDRTNMSLCNPISTPADPAVTLSASMCPQSDEEKLSMAGVPYRETVGALQYLVCGSRPDISAAVSAVSRFTSNPGPKHWQAVKRILRYLKGTSRVGITLGGSEDITLTGYCDADWAGDVDSRKSTTGFVFLLGSGPVSWKSKLQPTTALSTMEADYMALSSATQEALWLRQLLHALGYEEGPTTIYEDNQGCIKFVQSTKFSPRAKHIDVRHFFVHDHVESKDIALSYVPSAENLADLFTKPLPAPTFLRHRKALASA